MDPYWRKRVSLEQIHIPSTSFPFLCCNSCSHLPIIQQQEVEEELGLLQEEIEERKGVVGTITDGLDLPGLYKDF